MNTVDIESEDQAEIEGEAGQQLRELLPVLLTLRVDLSDIGNVVLALRALGGFDSGPMHYPIYRLARVAARRPLDELFDDLAQHAGLAAHRLGEGSLLLDAPGVLVSGAPQDRLQLNDLRHLGRQSGVAGVHPRPAARSRR